MDYVFVLGDDVGEQLLCDQPIVALLLEIQAIDLTSLQRLGFEGRVHLEHRVFSSLLFGEDLKRLGGVAWGDDSVRNLEAVISQAALGNTSLAMILAVWASQG